MCLLLGSALLGAACGGAATEPARPSVLLVTVDTLRPDYLSWNGYEHPTSPAVDALLSASWYFPEAISPMGRTTPALASLLTGAYPHTTGVRSLSHRLSDDVVPVAEVLSDAGYQTWAVVTNQVLSPNRNLDRGFEFYQADHAVRPAVATTDFALEIMAMTDLAGPEFAWVHWVDPHVPYHPDPEVRKDFAPDYEGRYKESFGHQPRAGELAAGYLPYPEDLPKSDAVHQNALPDEVNRHIRTLYAGDIRTMDAEIGRFVGAFLARRPNTIVIFTSDHGESLGEHDFFYDHGDYVYGASTRVPLAVMLPESHALAGSGRCPGWVSLVDVVPTLVDLLGLETTSFGSQIEGRSLTPCMRGETVPPAPVFVESGELHFVEDMKRPRRPGIPGRQRGVVSEGWKLVWTPFADDTDEGSGEYELYDLKSDPNETQNVYREDHPRASALHAALREWMERRHQGPDGHRPSEQDVEALRALGYIE